MSEAPKSGDGRSAQKRSELFVSCDLVGSTALKQQGEPWEDILLSFYINFPEQLGEMADQYDIPFELWKPIGDELVFKVKVEREGDIARGVRAWLAALSAYESDPSYQRNVGRKTKGGAFIATFPGPDVEASVLRDPRTRLPTAPDLAEINDAAIDGRDHETHIFDYFGPSFDTGFRVIGQSTPRHFTLSAEVAWSMLRAVEDQEVDDLDDLVFLGGRELKGVWGGRDYPIFAIDRHHSDKINVAMKAMLGQEKLDREAAKHLLSACVLTDDLTTKLFLPKSGHESLKKEPDDALEGLRKSGDAVREGIEEQPEESPPDAVRVEEDQFRLGDRPMILSEVMEFLHIKPGGLERFRQDWGFPEPDDFLEDEDQAVPVWYRSTIAEFNDEIVESLIGEDAATDSPRDDAFDE